MIWHVTPCMHDIIAPVYASKKSIDIASAANSPAEWQPFALLADCMDFDRFAYLPALEHMLSWLEFVGHYFYEMHSLSIWWALPRPMCWWCVDIDICVCLYVFMENGIELNWATADKLKQCLIFVHSMRWALPQIKYPCPWLVLLLWNVATTMQLYVCFFFATSHNLAHDMCGCMNALAKFNFTVQGWKIKRFWYRNGNW